MDSADITEDVIGPDSDVDYDSDVSSNSDDENDEMHNSDFSWRTVTPNSKFEPNVGNFDDNKERFGNYTSQHGITLTPFGILKTFLTQNIMDNMVDETNKYADEIRLKSRKALPDWTRVALSEMWTFLGLMLLTGLVKKVSYKDYWSTDDLLETPIFSKSMSRNRFEHILRSFHLANNLNNGAAAASGKLWKLGNFLPNLLKNFLIAINPGEFICVDESLVLFKGRLSFKQFMPLKRSRFGIKYFALVDCQTKFLVKLQVYLGKSENVDAGLKSQMGMAGATVCKLLEGYYGQNHKVVLDNWFNSPKLMEHLYSLRTYCVGTVRKNRKGLPKNMKSKLPKGAAEVQFTQHLLLERWQDRREVLMLNSFITHEMIDSLSSNPRNHRLKPKSVLLYNKKMGGVDHIDQQLAPYESLRKSIKWYKKFAFHIVDLAVYNSFIIFKSLNPNSTVVYKQFLTNLIREILDANRTPRKLIGRPPKLSNIATNIAHWPKKNSKENNKPRRSDCAFCKQNNKRKTTPYSCETCKKFLCIDGTDSCFKKFHNQFQSTSNSVQNVNQLSHFDVNSSLSSILSSQDFASQSQSLLSYGFDNWRRPLTSISSNSQSSTLTSQSADSANSL